MGITDSKDMSLSTFREIVKDREAWHAAIHEHECQTWLSDWTTATKSPWSLVFLGCMWRGTEGSSPLSSGLHSQYWPSTVSIWVCWLLELGSRLPFPPIQYQDFPILMMSFKLSWLCPLTPWLLWNLHGSKEIWDLILPCSWWPWACGWAQVSHTKTEWFGLHWWFWNHVSCLEAQYLLELS